MDGGEAKADRAGLGGAGRVFSGEPLGRAVVASLAVSVADDASVEAGQQRQLTGDRFEANDVVARNGSGMQQNGCDR